MVGKYGVYTLDEARSKAKKYLTGLENTDPLEVRKAAMKAGNVATLCKQYLDNYAKPHKKSWRKDESRINRHILPQWGNQKVHAITNDDICVLHKRIGGSPERPGRPYEANRTLELLKVMFKLSKEWGYIPDKVLRTWNNPAAGVKAYEETKRDRWIRPHEVPRLSDAIDAEPNPYIRAAFWLYL